MTITSEILLDQPLSNSPTSKRLIVEKHTDSVTGNWEISKYLANSTDTQAQLDQILASRNTDLTDALVDNEVKQALYGDDPAFVWQNATNNDVAAFARTNYRDLPTKDLRRVLIARRILQWLSTARFTDAQFMSVFTLDSTQWTNLKAKMQLLVDSQDVLDNAVGE